MSDYVLIGGGVLASSVSEVTFSSIPTSVDGVALRDLVVVCSVFSDSGFSDMRVNLNGNFTTNAYQRLLLNSSGAFATAADEWRVTPAFGNTVATTVIIEFMEYTSGGKHKHAIVRSGNPGGNTALSAWRWTAFSSINTIRVAGGGTNFAAGSNIALYGIAG